MLFMIMGKNLRSTLFLRWGQIDWWKDQVLKDRRGLEQEKVEALSFEAKPQLFISLDSKLLFEWTPWDIANIALVF